MNGLIIPDASLLTTKQRQVDQSIDANTQEIEDCLENIESLLKDLPSLDNSSSLLDLEDCLSRITNYHSLEKTSCYDLDLEDLQNFFSKMNDFLSKNPGKEESVFTMLLKLCSHTGFTLPWKASGQGGQSASMMSLNVVNDQDEQMCEALWEEVRRALEDHIIACLYQLPVTNESCCVRLSRSEYIEKMHLLTSTRQLCQQYRSLRVCSLNQLINDQMSSVGDSPGFPQIVSALERIAGYVITMIDGDFHLLISGIFRKVSTTFEIISSIYFDKLTDELESVLDDLANEIYGHLDSRLTSRRQSDFALADKLKEKITKSKSKTKLERVTSTGTISNEADVHLDHEIAMSMVRLSTALNTVEQHVYNLYLMSYTGLRGTSAHSTHSAERIRGVLKSTSVTDISILSDSLTSDASELQTLLHTGRLQLQSFDKAPQVVDKPMHHDKPLFLWQQSLKRFVNDLSMFVETRINNAAEACIGALSSRDRPVTIKLCSRHRGSKMEYPVTVWKAVADFVLALESVFPLAQAGHTLLPVRQAFISGATSWSKNLLVSLDALVERVVPVKEGNKVILAAIGSIALLRNTLYQCDSILHKDSEKQNSFVLVYHQTCQVVDALAQQYVTLQVELINSSILHDSDSFNWSENKEFYEAERCSFPVQTWSYYMQATRLELWDICPPSNAVGIFSDILKQTLDCLTLRYLNEFPSYRRTEQYRLDIGTILYTMYELMFFVCSNSSQLLDLESVAFEQPYFALHSSCCKLLAALAVITSPLEELYKVYKKGYQRRSRRRRQHPESEDEPGYYSHWLSWIQPDIMPKGITKVSDMQTTTALYIQIRLMLASPEPPWSKLIQVINMKDFTLPIMILTQSDITIGHLPKSADYDNPAYQSTNETASPRKTGAAGGKPVVGCQLEFCDSSCQLDTIQTLFEPFLMVLVECNKPSALYEVLLPVISRGDQWTLLSSEKFYQNMQKQMPEWMKVILRVIERNVSPVIKATMLAVCQLQSKLQNDSLDIRAFLQTLPCGCDLDEEVYLKHEALWNDTIVESILSGLGEEVSKLPISVCVLLERLGNYLHTPVNMHSSATANSSAADRFILQVIGYCVSQCVSSSKFLERCNNGKLPSDILARLQESTQCVYASFSRGTDVTGLQLSKEQMNYLVENHHWISEQKQTILSNIKRRESLWPDLDVDGGTAESFTEFATTGIVSEILETPQGECYLRQIYNVISNNQDWLYLSLDIHGSLPEISPAKGKTFIPDIRDHTDERTTARLNPLTLYKSVGDSHIDFEVIRSQTQIWTNLLQSDLGLSDLSMANLLQHRHDFQDGAQLEPNEKKHVESLKAKFQIATAHE